MMKLINPAAIACAGWRVARPHVAVHVQVLLPGMARPLRVSVIAMARPWRPDVNDVDRLSKGDGAKKRGTGNFNIPHRLNSDERPVFEAAKKKGYLQVRGTGYRKGRKGNPLPNIYRQWCDAKAAPCIVIEQDTTGSSRDVVVVDLAPLRMTDLSRAVAVCNRLAQAAGARHVPTDERPLDAVPFNTLPVDLPQTVQQMLYPHAASAGASAPPPTTPEQLQAAEMAVMQQADLVRQLKVSGLSNSSSEVQKQVQDLLRLKAELQQLLNNAAATEAGLAPSQDDGSSASSHIDDSQGPGSAPDAESSSSSSSSSGGSSRREVLAEDHPFATAAIWMLPVMPIFYEADRAAAKGLAKELCSELAGVTAGVAR